jgi:hypothetical protein
VQPVAVGLGQGLAAGRGREGDVGVARVLLDEVGPAVDADDRSSVSDGNWVYPFFQVST